MSRHRAPREATLRDTTDGLRVVLELVALVATAVAHVAFAALVTVLVLLALPWIG